MWKLVTSNLSIEKFVTAAKTCLSFTWLLLVIVIILVDEYIGPSVIPYTLVLITLLVINIIFDKVSMKFIPNKAQR
jgi:hypothetical protein